MKKTIPSLLAVLFVSAFPVLFLYFQNAAEIAPAELWAPLGLFVLIGFVLFGISLLFVRKIPTAAVISSLFMLLFSNYTLLQTGIRKLLPALGFQHILPILLFLAGHLAWRIHKKPKQETLSNLALLLCIAFGGLSLFNGVLAVPDIAKTLNAQKTAPSADIASPVSDTLYPNLYYFILDEYSNFDIIEKYYGYDNSPFATHLENKGFTVSYNSVNDSQQTPTILANLFSLDYLVKDPDSATVKENARKNSMLQQTLSASGYRVQGLGLASDYMNIPTVSGTVLGSANKATTMGGADFFTLLLQNTAAGPLLPQNDGNAERQMLHDVIAHFSNPGSYTRTHNTATVAYLKMPHQPFVFTATGGENNLMNWHNWSDPEQYLGQFIYTTTVVQEMVDNILQNDPGAVIILQSDHSARSLQSADGTYLIDKLDRRHFLNAVYFAGEPLDAIKDKSGVNTLRIVLEKLLQHNFPEVEVPVSEYEF